MADLPTTKYCTQRQAALYMELNERTVRKLIDAGALGYVLVGKRRRLFTEEVRSYEARQRRRAS